MLKYLDKIHENPFDYLTDLFFAVQVIFSIDFPSLKYMLGDQSLDVAIFY